MNDQKTDNATSKEDLNLQTATVEWQELVKHFARGVVIHVDSNLDLVEVAHGMASDDVQLMQNWLDSGSVRRASDEDARDWTMREPHFWCVVAAPWVLVQERIYREDLH